MSHGTPLVSTIVVGLVLAFIFGAIANRLRMPPLVGYLVAGVLVGPFTPGFVADTSIASELSEIGVILLMFGVGLHFSLKDLLSVQALAVPGALLRIAAGTLMGLVLGLGMGWSVGAGLLFGLALSVASTVVLLKALQDRHLIDSEKGRIAVGWVIVEDIAMVLALVLIPALASLWGVTAVELDDPFVTFVERILNTDIGIAGVLAVTVIKLTAFVGFMLVVGRRIIPGILHFTAHTGSRELFRLAVLAIALGVAAGAAYLFGVSLALGAFFAGMILSESELSHRAAQESLPLRDAFGVLFFVSVGMLFNPMILVLNPVPVLGTLFVILFGKSLVAFLIVVAFRRPVSAALTIAASLAQIGEFSFILATLGLNLGILPQQGQDLIIAGAILSIVLNPALFWIVERMRPLLENRFGVRHAEADLAGKRTEPDFVVSKPSLVAPEPAADDEPVDQPTTKTGHTILIGYGRVGAVVGEGLKAAHKTFLVIEDAEDRVGLARAAGIEVIIGNAASPKVLGLANVAGANTVIIAIPNAFEAGQATEQCRKLNAGITIVARAHSDEEEAHLLHLGANTVILGEREIGLGMVDLVTRDRRAVAEILAVDAVEAALGDMAAPLVAPVTAAARVQWPVVPEVRVAETTEGQAEPVTSEDIADRKPLAVAEPEIALPAMAEVEVPPTAAPALIAPPLRPVRPATTAGAPFDPEVPPAAKGA